MEKQRSVAVIGAGPVGLAAAAQALERGWQPVVLEAGATVGAAIREWAHVRMFSPWRYNIDKASERLLQETGWNAPDPEAYPTGGELYERYLEPLAKRTRLAGSIKTSATVTSISRVGFDKVKSAGRDKAPFEVRYRNGAGGGAIRVAAVIDTSGTWRSPNPAGGDGTCVPGEAENSARIRYGMPDVLGRDRTRYAGKRVAVLGAGHSALGTLIDLVQLKETAPATEPVWILRGDDPAKSFGGGAADQLAERGALGLKLAEIVSSGRLEIVKSFSVARMDLHADRLRIASTAGRDVLVDELVVATGFRPDLSFLREIRVSLDPALECPPALAPLIDPNEHSCGTVRPHGARELSQPEPGFYIAGMKSYGRAPTFLMATGYEQVRSIVADIDGDKAAAAKVELELPETGVCSAPPALASLKGTLAAASTGCCGGPPKTTKDACCVADEKAKAAGAKGCGCSGK